MAIIDCCTEFQTECLKIVTIGYLKEFIGDNIRNSSGDVITITRTDDNYCPSYSELTNGSIIPIHEEGENPNDDVDGIVVSTICTNTGNLYHPNQMVNQKDLSLVFTRFSGFTISADDTTVDACEGTIQLGYSNAYARFKKYMNDDCEVPAELSASTTSGSGESEITWYKELSDASINPTTSVYTIGKNGTVSADTRYDHISATTVYKGSVTDSNVITITQKALSGDYTAHDSYYYITTSSSASATTDTAFTICGEVKYGADFILNQEQWETKHWKDSCGDEYSAITKDYKTSATSAVTYSSVTRTWEAISCPESSGSNTDTIAFTYTDPKSLETFSGSVSFSRSCEQSCCASNEYRIKTVPTNVDNIDECGISGGSLNVEVEYKCNTPGGEPSGWTPYNSFTVESTFVSGSDFVTLDKLEYQVAKNCTEESRTSTYNVRVTAGVVGTDICVDETYAITFAQKAGPCDTCECNCKSLKFGTPEIITP